MPGSRGGEMSRLGPDFIATAELKKRQPELTTKCRWPMNIDANSSNSYKPVKSRIWF